MSNWFTDNILGMDPEPPPTITTIVQNTNTAEAEASPIIDLNLDAVGQGLSDIAQANLTLGSFQLALEQAKANMAIKAQTALIENENARYKYMGSIALILGVGFILTRMNR